MKPSVILDCDLMKHPHSGLYHYCLNLGRETAPLLAAAGVEMAFYIPPKERTSFGPGARVIPDQRSWFRFFDRPLKKCSVWHAPFQSGRMVPDRNKFPRIKTVLTIHDLNQLHEGKPEAETRQSLEHTQSLIDRADVLVCISNFCKSDVLQHCDTSNKPVIVIHNGTHAVGRPLLGTDSYKPSRPFLFGLGYMNAKKNYRVLLPLLKDESLELVLAGRLDDPDYVEAMRQEARLAGVEERLHILGPVSESEKAWYYAHCLAFVHPSLAEGFGAPVAEVMQFGKPVFLSRRTSLPEIGGDAAYYFDRFDAEHLQGVLREGLLHFGRNGGAERARKQAAGFDWKRQAREYVKVYESLL